MTTPVQQDNPSDWNDPYALDPATSRSTLVNGIGGPEPPQPLMPSLGAAATTPPAPFNIGADATNGFGGVTYAGFSPQDHQGQDLNDPMNAKYALQQYMVQNGALTGGQGGNAKAIADALNAKYGKAYGKPDFFTAQDAETILMPDGTYVHAAPNGYGMAKGTFDPSNASEVFWGAQGDTGEPSSAQAPASPNTVGTTASPAQALLSQPIRTSSAPEPSALPPRLDLSQMLADLQSKMSREMLVNGVNQ